MPTVALAKIFLKIIPGPFRGTRFEFVGKNFVTTEASLSYLEFFGFIHPSFPGNGEAKKNDHGLASSGIGESFP